MGNKTKQNHNAFKGGSYSLTLIVIVLAILLVCNLFAASLPATMTKLDISSSKLYSITSNTKVVVNGLDKDVTIYWIVQAGEEDAIIENLLSKYSSLSDHIEIVKRNPDVYPNFAAQYTEENVANNSLIVESGERSRYISYNDIYVQQTDLYSYTYTTSFDGEGAITSAIDYVVSEDLPLMYVLEGHGEAALPATFAEQLKKENIETSPLSLLTIEEIPEDADCLMIYAPSSDISTKEATMLQEYISAGGKVLVAAGPIADGMLENLNSLLSYYNVTVNEGIVIEGSSDNNLFGYADVLLPEMNNYDITAPLIEENYFAVMPGVNGLTVKSSGNGSISTLLETTEDSFSKLAGFGLTTYAKEEGDIDGPFAASVAIEDNNGGQLIWFASSDYLEDMYNAYSSGANVDLTMNALASLLGEQETMTIRSKSLNYNFLTISQSTSSLLKILMIGVFPLTYLGIGITIVLYRRRNQK